ncbi:TPR-like protein, partial [Aureobasidium melanogenum]
MDDAIAAFRSALEESNSDPNVVCLLVQVLWAKGGEEEKSVARDQLFDCIEKHDSHVPSIVLLGAIAALDNDTDALDAVRDDLASLRTNDTISIYDREHVEQVLGAIAELSSDASEMDALVETQRAIMLAPHQSHGWTQLTELTEEAYPAQMALLTSQRAVPPYGDLGAQELAKAFADLKMARIPSRSEASVDRAIAPRKDELVTSLIFLELYLVVCAGLGLGIELHGLSFPVAYLITVCLEDEELCFSRCKLKIYHAEDASAGTH